MNLWISVSLCVLQRDALSCLTSTMRFIKLCKLQIIEMYLLRFWRQKYTRWRTDRANAKIVLFLLNGTFELCPCLARKQKEPGHLKSIYENMNFSWLPKDFTSFITLHWETCLNKWIGKWQNHSDLTRTYNLSSLATKLDQVCNALRMTST